MMEPLIIWTALIFSLPFLQTEPKTSVILLDNESVHNAIDITTQKGRVSIDTPYMATTLTSLEQLPSTPSKVDTALVLEKYASELNSLPTKPVSMLFYFEQGTADLTAESKNQVQQLVEVIAERTPASIDIIGHSDRAGDADKNYQLALQRAHSVESFLKEKEVMMDRVSVISHGEEDPIIVTEDGVSEPKNRRVEVIVR